MYTVAITNPSNLNARLQAAKRNNTVCILYLHYVVTYVRLCWEEVPFL